jgi:hypothetical protein
MLRREDVSVPFATASPRWRSAISPTPGGPAVASRLIALPAAGEL